MRYSPLLSVLAVIVALAACEGPNAARQTDQAYLVRSNPALADYQARKPGAMKAVLEEIEVLRAQPTDPNVQLPQKDRTLTGDPERQHLIEVLKANPLLMEIYKKDQKATVKLIKIIRQ